MKNKSRPLIIAAILSGTLASLVVGYLMVFPKLAIAQTSTYPMHDFTFDTLGQSLLITGTTPNPSGDLKESQNGATIQDWSIKYEWKGGMRSECRPPVLNVTFSSGNPDGKFHGLSTYDGKSILKYKKVRLIPECDGWNDYTANGSDIGFSGQLNVNLREYIIFKIFRAFGVPTTDIVGFANVRFLTTDPGYAGRTFRYMMVARDNESSDEVPFTTQFNLNSSLYESGDNQGGKASWTPNVINRLTSASIVSKTDNTDIHQLSFDPDTTIRLFLLTEVLNLEDVAPLHNEDWGINLTTGKTEIIPHGFDAAFSCGMTVADPANTYVSQLISGLSNDIRPSYQSSYYGIARNIFGSSASLDQMIALVNQFPYSNVDKTMLIEYLKIRFYQYASYFTSASFAQAMGQTYHPIAVTLPFTSKQVYESHLSAFLNHCALTKIRPPGVTANVVGVGTLQTSQGDQNWANATFNVDIHAGPSALQVLRSGAFAYTLVGTGDNHNSNINLSYDMPSTNVTDVPGPYYLISPNSTARFVLTGSVRRDGLLKDTYRVRLDSFQPNYKVVPFTFNASTNPLTFGALDPISVTAPATGSNLSVGSHADIVWTGGGNQLMQIWAEDSNGYNMYYLADPNRLASYANNTYTWTVGKYYYYNGNAWVLADIPSGSYKIVIQDNNSGLSGKSGEFTITDPNATPASVTIVGTPTLALKYDPSGGEAGLVNTFTVGINPGNVPQKLQKEGAFSIFDVTGNGFNWSGPETYTQRGATDDGFGYFNLPANTVSTFTVTMTANPKQMFAGAYHGSLTQVVLGQYPNLQFIPVTTANTTNNVVIIGEVSPYLNSLSPNPATPNQTVTITGVRFSKTAANVVTLMAQLAGRPSTPKTYSVVSANGSTLQFVPNVPVGVYSVQVTHPVTGSSNNMTLTISGIASSPTPIPYSQGSVSAPTPSPTPSSTPAPASESARTSSYYAGSSASQSSSPSPTPSISHAPSPTPSVSVTASPTPSSSPSPTPSHTPSPSSSPAAMDLNNGSSEFTASVYWAFSRIMHAVLSR